MEIIMNKKIFISHASEDDRIGELLLDAMLDLGVNKDDVFYSSKYHNGVRIGYDFNQTIKDALLSSELVIFLLTNNFYASPNCLNEMGAAWIQNKQIIPILLDGLKYSDMKGFIDNRHIAFDPKEHDPEELLSYLKKYIPQEKHSAIGTVFKKFVDFVNNNSSIDNKSSTKKDTENELEIKLTNSYFTIDEKMLLAYFYKNRYIDMEMGGYYDGNNYIENKNYVLFKDFCKKVDIDHSNAMKLLVADNLARYIYDENDDIDRFELDISTFRKLISVSSDCSDYLERLIESRINSIDNNKETQTSKLSKLDKIILDPKFREVDALLLAYAIENRVYEFGARWMADQQIRDISNWEHKINIYGTLSQNYEVALKGLIQYELVDPSSFTAYGNPRQYRLKDEYIKQLNNLSDKSIAVLKKVLMDNDEPLPF